MKLKFLYLLLLPTLFSCYNVERKCKDFKTGRFYSEVKVADKIYKSTFTRTENLQVEIYDGKIDSSQVRWVNDCEVIYRTINPKNMAERKDVHLKILTTTDSSYTFEYSYVGEINKQKGIAYKKD
ncbi:DNA topoisomerase IV [Psychroserpens sp. NJDZ02]|uniref:DNA topoisomerase IV n=1 Tax=Psychroserpens sp. NJDZ02 TaxID=2570561 RepID=UPI0010A88465|nr:DNA topoisomerase IV [Psychroserpens sp. NJDZ02]QCE42817.1 DNA topoisomerase IV [Psychroserpens sp. NJDZ02]